MGTAASRGMPDAEWLQYSRKLARRVVKPGLKAPDKKKTISSMTYQARMNWVLTQLERP